jgi:hypothetical protein
MKPILLLSFCLAVECDSGVLAGHDPRKAPQPAVPPAYCQPCLFYGGDFDINGPTPNALIDQDAADLGYSAVYVPFAVPPNQTWTVIGLFSNSMSTIGHIYPPQIEWSISSGISQGNSGVLIASGTINATYTPTGRSWNGMNEYTALGRLSPETEVKLTSGHYWMTAVPVCTDLGPNQCQGARYYLSDVEDVPAPQAKGFESTDESYFNSPVFDDFFVETGGPNGLCSQPGIGGCDKFSVGLLGQAVQN